MEYNTLPPMKTLKLRLNALLFAAAAAVLITGLSAAEKPSDPDIALKPAHVIVNPWRFHIPPTKRQGVSGIERTANGRLWAVYGRDVESSQNYQVLTLCDNDGRSWSDAQLMILPRRGVRAMSAKNWIDPQGRLLQRRGKDNCPQSVARVRNPGGEHHWRWFYGVSGSQRRRVVSTEPDSPLLHSEVEGPGH